MESFVHLFIGNLADDACTVEHIRRRLEAILHPDCGRPSLWWLTGWCTTSLPGTT